MRKKAFRKQSVSRKPRAIGTLPKPRKCPVCSQRIRDGVAYFSFGAVVEHDTLRKKKLDETALEAFCDVGYHGADPDMRDSANYRVADGVPGGQVELSFCCLACLKKWFCDIVDQLERDTIPRKGKKPNRQSPTQARG